MSFPVLFPSGSFSFLSQGDSGFTKAEKAMHKSNGDGSGVGLGGGGIVSVN